MREKDGNKDDFQVSGVSNWVIGAIYQDERKAEGVTTFGKFKVKFYFGIYLRCLLSEQ